MIFDVTPVGPYQANCYLVGDEVTGEAVLVDPGDEAGRLLAWVHEHGLRITHILLTHGHLDHIGAVAAVKAATGAKVCIHSGDALMLADPQRNMSAYSSHPVTAPPPDVVLEDDQVITVGGLRFKVLHTPGHTPGGVCFLVTDGEGDPKLLLSGDTLFAGSIGRTDLPGGNLDELLTSAREQLLVLPEDLPVYPGHGESTNVGDEREGNPFLA
ncbi:MAG: MBL fold metallo-hydrolase [Symbiobacteriia bacterium]